MIGKLMLTLALETSTSQGSLALFDGEALLESYHFQALRGHNSKIYRPLESMLDVLGDRRLDRLVVGTGPGSYTGVRIAIAIADALALSHGAALIGCCSMIAAKLGETEEHYWVAGDARRDSWYRAEVRSGALVGELITESRELWKSAVDEALAANVPVRTFDPKSPLVGVEIDVPTAERLGRVSQSMSANARPVEPTYLAPPYITTPKKTGKVL